MPSSGSRASSTELLTFPSLSGHSSILQVNILGFFSLFSRWNGTQLPLTPQPGGAECHKTGTTFGLCCQCWALPAPEAASGPETSRGIGAGILFILFYFFASKAEKISQARSQLQELSSFGWLRIVPALGSTRPCPLSLNQLCSPPQAGKISLFVFNLEA